MGRAMCRWITTGSMAFVANYAGGSFAAFRVTNVGSLAQAIGVFKYTQATHGPVADRQDAAHIHCAMIAPGNRYVLACDLGDDVILVFPVDAGGGRFCARADSCEARGGVRAAACGVSSEWEVCLLHSRAGLHDRPVRLALEQGQPVMRLRENSVVSTLAKGASTKGKTACEIVISDDGRFLYSCTRGEGSNTITVWRIDENGYLTEHQRAELRAGRCRGISRSIRAADGWCAATRGRRESGERDGVLA